jgi:hypothetical protein
MPAVPAFCDTCGTAFSSGFSIENSRGSFTGCRSGPCPKCGGMGHVLDGVFNFVGDTIEILSAPERTVVELRRLAALLLEATERRAPPEEVVKTIQAELPWFHRLADLLPTNRGELYGFLALVLAAAQLTSSPSSTTNNITVHQVVERACPSQQQAPVPAQRNVKKQGRNEQCACGSGKKHKKCCGNAAAP